MQPRIQTLFTMEKLWHSILSLTFRHIDWTKYRFLTSKSGCYWLITFPSIHQKKGKGGSKKGYICTTSLMNDPKSIFFCLFQDYETCFTPIFGGDNFHLWGSAPIGQTSRELHLKKGRCLIINIQDYQASHRYLKFTYLCYG